MTMRHKPIIIVAAVLSLGSAGMAQTQPNAVSESAEERVEQPGGTAPPRPQPAAPQLAFRTPEQGFSALADAIRKHDERWLLRILGSGARSLIRSGDTIADRAQRGRFTEAYEQKAEIVRPAPDQAVLQVGPDAWPLPIPMIQRNGAWRFDARRGAQELINRRIGRNELDTIQVLHAIVDAQLEYAKTEGRQGSFEVYARRLFSSPGRRDGLYWPTRAGDPESPLGPFAAAASLSGYGAPPKPGDTPRAYHGYFYRILEEQGPDAPGGAMDYVVQGRMIGGFGVIAVPAQYGVSGIQTFIVSHAGTIYERNFGPETARLTRAIVAFNPGPEWRRVAD